MTATTTPLVPSAGTAAPRRGGRGFRTDIQGLRAVAVLLVLAYHAGVPQISGGYVGVDVFFVISGFLITGLIVREVESTGSLSLVRFYARRARRLLPAAALAMVGTAVITLAVIPPTRWASIAGDFLASTFYVVNWRLAERSVDYLGSEQAASPLQHFWSLAVEEQFYVLWPLLIVALVWWQRRRGVALRPTLVTGLLAVAVPSLAWSAWLTATDPGRAYFVTTTRLWELAIGGLLVFWLHRFDRLGPAARHVLGWGGLAAILASAVLYTSATPFPGLAALLPTLGAAAVLVAGVADPSHGVGRVLGVGAMQDVGAASYSLYLWHWPVLVGATALWGGEEGQLWLPTAVVAIGASAVPAWFAYRAVERPLHESRRLAAHPRPPLVLGAVCMVVGVGLAVGLTQALAVRTGDAGGPAPGAHALGTDPTTSPAGEVVATVQQMVPDPVLAVEDIADPDHLHCNSGMREEGLAGCVIGDPAGEVTVALVGDSHAWHWQPAVTDIAERRGWRLEIYTKSSCGFFDATVSVGNPPVENTVCREYDEELMEYLLGPDGPDVVLASGSNNYRPYTEGGLTAGEEAEAALEQAYADRWRQVLDAGLDMVVLRNTPWVSVDVPDCLAQNPGAVDRCASPRDAAMDRAGDTEARAAARVSEVNLVDVNDWVCPQERCSPVIGGVVVFRDEHHLTATYSRSLSDALEGELLRTGVFE